MVTQEENLTITELKAVSLKLPTFWTFQPDIWFYQTEAQFAIQKITSDNTKYSYVIAALDQEAATRLLNYINIKRQLLNAYGLTRRDRAQKLLDVDGLGDRKPSQLLSEILGIAGGHTSCLLFEELFNFSNLDEMGSHADAIWQSKSSHVGIGAIKRYDKKPSYSVKNRLRQKRYLLQTRIFVSTMLNSVQRPINVALLVPTMVGNRLDPSLKEEKENHSSTFGIRYLANGS
ncbi:hypothetical protein RF11_00896 [Thelohanellus kitauei]|uniref:DUF7041 domain-containing protein n=1 Tax=Thelohanellus kitauei TaxID=669202 RepID=A0A0C2N3I5_THEKT|nr:hypothetical protein RF11_00896 [Thelohanellus kitauei]